MSNRKQIIVRPNVLKQRRVNKNYKNKPKALTKTFDLMSAHTEAEFMRQNYGAVVIPRLQFTPETIIADLVYPDTFYNRNNASSPFLSWRYRMNSIYDPDPLVGSGSVPGYTYYSGGYSNYIVLGLGYDISLSNLEGSPVDVVVWPTTNDVGNNYASTSEAFGNPHATQSLLSAKGGQDRARLKGWVDVGRFQGNMTQYLGGNYSSVFGSNPSQILYLNVGAVESTNFTTNNGLDIRAALTYRTAFFNRKIVIS